jgi:hypothetical protein
VETETTLGLELLAELRAELMTAHEVRSELRDSIAGLAVSMGFPGVYLWVFISYSGRYFSWGLANKQHPVKDVAGAARRIARGVKDPEAMAGGS